MLIRQSIRIAAAPEIIWNLVADPVLQANWNCAVVAVDRPRSGPVQVGERYAMIYAVNGQDRPCQIEVLASLRPQRVVFCNQMTWKNTTRIVEEAYDISPDRAGSRVVQSVDLSRAAIPWFARAIIWLLSRLGYRVGPDPLQKLKRLAEAPVAPAP